VLQKLTQADLFLPNDIFIIILQNAIFVLISPFVNGEIKTTQYKQNAF